MQNRQVDKLQRALAFFYLILCYVCTCNMKLILAIGTGSFIGGISRYLLSLAVQQRFISAFPFATFTVNVIGCFLIGVAYGFSERTSLDPAWRLFLTTGFLGGFTTFSAFSNETFGLLHEGHVWYASAYVIASVVLGVLATWAGYAMFRLS
jgi:CrcB protein